MSVTFEQRASNWKLFAPPARPSLGEVAIYLSLLGELQPISKKASVLGCTPELRDSLNRLGFDYTCIDQSPEIYKSTELLMETDNPGAFEYCNWTELFLPKGTKVLLGDGSINMLPANYQEKLIQRIKDEMPGGCILLLRVHLRGERLFNTAEEIIAHHRQHSKGISSFSALRTDLDMLWIDEETGTVNLGECGCRLSQFHRDGLLTDEEWQPFESILPINNIQLHYSRTDELRAAFEPEFEFIDEHAAADYPRADLHPVWALRRVTK